MAAGEQAGALDAILNKLAIYLERTEFIKSKVKRALVYPSMIGRAVQNLVDNLSAQSLPGSLHAVFGILSDKDLAAIVQIIAPRLMSWHLVDTPGPRGQSAEQLKCRLTTLGVEHNIHACGSLDRALKSATEQAGQDASILIFGSFLVVGDFLNSLNKQALN